MGEDELITLSQAATLTGIPRRRLAYGATRGNLRTKQVGAIYLTTLKWVNEWDKNEQAHTPGPKPRTKSKP